MSDADRAQFDALLAERRLRARGWEAFERSTRRAAMRAIRRVPDDAPEPDANAT